ncbi:hypothetical protein JMJ77_0013359 [Colletotrichum scovillei]|uniref:Uncharacterized protein n=1 Tax=Colletotrichum scovillei TaxID=1209932 RepID=A0A9P7UD07_9PEZI|nr:hypothetical protein JMJ77_0013359 [Colletotrichum scovillei]KAG7069660.1 hypothetical protein JMJ76_0003323 [Colletotrichum scovillei]KAG7073534.1 hypothetical protein JMJ78_0014507 [Colletotrichum scovillei]
MLFESWSARIRVMDRSSVARLNPPMVPTRSRPFRTPTRTGTNNHLTTSNFHTENTTWPWPMGSRCGGR